MSDSPDRRKSPSREDSRLTGRLINSTMGYLQTDSNPDAEFADVVLTGCLEGKGPGYPPKGHGYPSTKR